MGILKKIIYKLTARIRNSVVDTNAEISYMCLFYWSEIKSYSYVSHHTSVFHTSIGKFTSIGAGCFIGGGEHPLKWVSTSPVFTSGRTFNHEVANLNFNPYKDTFIGNDVYIAANVVIKSGVRINDGAVIGAGSVVTHDVPAYEIWAGNPAKKIAERFTPDVIARLNELQWWDWNMDKIKKNAHLFNNIEAFLDNNK